MAPCIMTVPAPIRADSEIIAEGWIAVPKGPRSRSAIIRRVLLLPMLTMKGESPLKEWMTGIPCNSVNSRLSSTNASM